MTQRQSVSIPLQPECTGAEFFAQPVSAAVPFEKGALASVDELSLFSGERSVTSTTQVTARWPDESIKWCVVKWVAEPDQSGRVPGYTLQSASELSANCAAFDSTSIEETQSALYVNCGEMAYRFHRDGQSIFPDVYRCDESLVCGTDCAVEFEAGVEHSVQVLSADVVSHGPATALVHVCAEVTVGAEQHLKLTFKYEISGSWLRTVVQVHNPHRAHHAEAVWDLGDPGSIVFSHFALRLPGRQQSLQWQLEAGQAVEPVADPVTLLQASSGGEHWDSPTHVDAQSTVPNRFKGYRAEFAAGTTVSGDRASPVILVGDQFGFICRQFWQNFPKCLDIPDDSIVIGLFPKQHGSNYELQGGERKQHEIVFGFSGKQAPESLRWVDEPTVFTVPVDYLTATGVLRYGAAASNDNPYQQVLATGHDSAQGFLAKREQIDEYGWRNFGDVFADHETLYHDTDDIFVSHYNNQYDAIYGFARQYLLSGDARWGRLLTDLFRHVVDIDIYHTDEDRAEYNHGLFWHTDHYKKAYTCSHRTYSRSHYPEEWNGDQGGGPGSEHCYTSGLLLYYQMTGDADARDAVLGLTSWIRYYYEGTGTILEAGKRLATDERRNAVAICRGHQVFRYAYGFDRGVGNYIRALLDGYEITHDRSYLTQAEKVISGTFGCNDDIPARQLEDIEGTWYYTVFLQEVIRYLDLKRSWNEFDNAFTYARDALLHYAHWMSINEEPYLEQPERLEYPNDTWIAQDIRKANVLYAAYRYETKDREALLAKAKFFRDYVVENLSVSPTRHFARIQIILLQNHGPSDLIDQEAEPYAGVEALSASASPGKDCFLTPTVLVGNVLGTMGRAVVNFNPKNEIRWVRARLG